MRLLFVIVAFISYALCSSSTASTGATPTSKGVLEKMREAFGIKSSSCSVTTITSTMCGKSEATAGSEGSVSASLTTQAQTMSQTQAVVQSASSTTVNLPGQSGSATASAASTGA